MPEETLSAVNINELPIVEEIKSGSYVLVETTDGTGIIDYKNFIIGTDNITFSDLLSTQDAQILALSAQVQSLESTLTALTGLSSFNIV
jgi:hypothetical protein